MKKEKQFSGLTPAEAAKKHKELASELVKFKVTMDPSAITAEGGVAGLKRALRVLGRQAAQLSVTTKEGV